MRSDRNAQFAALHFGKEGISVIEKSVLVKKTGNRSQSVTNLRGVYLTRRTKWFSFSVTNISIKLDVKIFAIHVLRDEKVYFYVKYKTI